MTKKFLSALLAVLMVVSMVPMAAMAAEGDNPPATTLPDPVNGVITLTEDLTFNTELQLSGDVTIDLGGHTLTTTAADNDDGIWVKDGSNITFQNGTLAFTPAEGASYIFGINAYGNLTLDDVTINNVKGTAIYTKSAVVLKNTNITAQCGVTLCETTAASVTMTGGKITATGTGTNCAGIFSNGGTSDAKKTITINGGTIESSSYGVALREYGTLTVNGDSSNIKGTYGITTNGTDRNTKVDVLGGKINGTDIGIYAPAPVSVTVENAEVTGVTAGIVVRGAALKVNEGAKISVTGTTGSTAGDATQPLPPSAIILDHIGGGYEKGSVEITGGEITATIGQPAVAAVNNSGKSITITGGTFSSDPFGADSGITSATHVSVLVNDKYVVKVDTTEKDDLVAKIVKDMGNCSPVDGAPLHDTRTEEQGGIPDEELYTAETYTVTVTSSDLQPYDLDVNVAAKGLKGHQNADSPASMGYWVGVRFPVVDGWTITKYQRDKHAEATITEADLTTDADGNKKTLDAYYNVGDASEDVENPRQRPVTVTYKKDGSEKTVDVKFLVKLTGVEIVVPAAKPEEDGTLSEQTKKDITSAITAAATGSSENHEDTEVADTQPTVSVKTATSGTVTINKEIVEALKEVAEDNTTTNVDLKIVGQGGAEATIPASTAKELDTANDLVPTVKAEDATTKAEETANKVTDEAKKAIVTQALETLTTEVVNAENKNYIVTVSMVQNGTEKFTTAGDCEITVKVPVPSSQYTVLVHIGKDGVVTTQAATPKSEVKDGKTSWYLSVKLTHLSTMFGAKPADVADIPAETPIAPDVTFVEPTDSTPDKNWYFPYSGELTITNNTGRERTYLIGLAKTAYGDNQAVFVQTIANGASWKVRCHKDMKLYLLELTSSVDLSSDDLPEDVIHRWKTVTEFVTQ